MIERVVQYRPTPSAAPIDITVRISAPQPIGREWTATLEIVGFETPHLTVHRGADSMFVVLAAARLAPVALRSIAGEGTLTWLGERDLGFPFEPFQDLGPSEGCSGDDEGESPA